MVKAARVLRRRNTTEVRKFGRVWRLRWLCSHCECVSPWVDDEPGNAIDGAAWKLASSKGWHHEFLGPPRKPGVLYIWCPLCASALAELERVEIRACCKCGCTDEDACDGGCEWVAADLCSACDA